VTKVEVDLFTNQGNGAVLRLPERKCPGVLVQGDTLNSFLGLLEEATGALRTKDLVQVDEALQEFSRRLEELRSGYEDALKQHGIPLPY
jgi:hypothetical protein